MIELIYSFYPKNIDSISMKEKYLESQEYKNLVNIINRHKEYPSNIVRLIDLLKEIDLKKRFDDLTVFAWEDRCFHFELSEIIGEKLIKIIINISVVAPYYHIRITDNKIDSEGNFIDVPQRNMSLETEAYSNILNMISTKIEETLSYSKFPEELLNEIITDINFHDVEMGNFTYYNALFLNEI